MARTGYPEWDVVIVAHRMTLAEITSLDAGSHVDPRFADQRIPTYEEVLEAARICGSSSG